MSGTPSGIVNRALDAIGRSDIVIGDLGEGTEAAKPALRAYGPALRQLLRASHWGFARAQKPMFLLGDATGQTPGAGTLVQAPWTYCYAWPNDCLKLRFVPYNTIPQQATTPPPTTASLIASPLAAIRLCPAPFLTGMDANYPPETGVPVSPDGIPDWASTEGTGPTQRTVILTNVPPVPATTTAPMVTPCAVYTALVLYPSQWDALFDEAFVAFLAQKLAMPLVPDKKLARVIRDDQIKIAQGILTQARAISANESGFPQTLSRTAEWIRARNAGGGNYGGWGGYGDSYSGPGMLFGAYDQCSFADGSVF